MPKYSFVVDNTFTPHSLERMLQPFTEYAKMYDAQHDALTEIMSKAEVWSKVLDPNKDPVAYERFNNYIKNLRAEADELATNGLSATHKSNLLNLKRGYTSDIIPIESAYTRKLAQVDAQSKDGANILHEYDARNKSLDDFLADPYMTYRSIDKADLTNRARTAYGDFATALEKTYNGGAVDPYYNKFITQYGLTPQEAGDYASMIRSGDFEAMKDTKLGNALYNIFAKLYNSSGVEEWSNNQNAQNAVQDAILEGLSASIGKSNVQLLTNQEKVFADQLKLAERKTVAKTGKGNGKGDDPYSTGSPGYQSQSINKFNNKEIREAYDELSQYIVTDQDGKRRITDEGARKLFGWLPPFADDAYVNPNRISPAGQVLIDMVNGGYSFLDNAEAGKTRTGLTANERERVAHLVDTLGTMDIYKSDVKAVPVFNIPMNDTTRELFGSSIAHAYGNNDWNEIIWDSKRGVYTDTELRKNKKIPKDSKPVALQIYPDYLAATYFIDDKYVSFKIPMDLNPAGQAAVLSAYNYAKNFTEILQTGRMPVMDTDVYGNQDFKRDANGRIIFTDTPLSPEARVYIDEERRAAEEAAGTNMINLTRAGAATVYKPDLGQWM